MNASFGYRSAPRDIEERLRSGLATLKLPKLHRIVIEHGLGQEMKAQTSGREHRADKEENGLWSRWERLWARPKWGR